MTDFNALKKFAEAVAKAPEPIRNAYFAFIMSSDGTYETTQYLAMLTDLLSQASKFDMPSRGVIGSMIQFIDSRNILQLPAPVALPEVVTTIVTTTASPPPEEIFNEPESGMIIAVNGETSKSPKTEMTIKVVTITKDMKFEEIYAQYIKLVCVKFGKDFKTALNVINKYKRPYTMICNKGAKCPNGKKYCWYAHSTEEQNDANQAHFDTLKAFYEGNKDALTFIDELYAILENNWEEFGNILAIHYKGKMPYIICRNGENCYYDNCKFNHDNDEKSLFFDKNKEMFKDMQFVKQPIDI